MREERDVDEQLDAELLDVPSASGPMLLDISNAIVRLHKAFHGKGPTKARSFLSQDVLVVVLEGGWTRGEETLLEHGYVDTVAQGRFAMQQSVEAEMRGVVEEITGCRVRSFLSANDPRRQVQTEIFLLESDDTEEGTGIGQRAKAARAASRDLSEEHRALLEQQKQAARELKRRREARRRREAG